MVDVCEPDRPVLIFGRGPSFGPVARVILFYFRNSLIRLNDLRNSFNISKSVEIRI
jgi:hypothetical protein